MEKETKKIYESVGRFRNNLKEALDFAAEDDNNMVIIKRGKAPSDSEEPEVKSFLLMSGEDNEQD